MFEWKFPAAFHNNIWPENNNNNNIDQLLLLQVMGALCYGLDLKVDGCTFGMATTHEPIVYVVPHWFRKLDFNSGTMLKVEDFLKL